MSSGRGRPDHHGRDAPEHEDPYPNPARFDTVFAEFTDEHGSVAVIDVPAERDAWLLSSYYVPIER